MGQKKGKDWIRYVGWSLWHSEKEFERTERGERGESFKGVAEGCAYHN